MIDTIRYLCSGQTEPYPNLALEEYLLHNVKAGECILYLWQNRHTVVIGKNQNCWKECRISQLQKDGGFIARRLSGGGAVFHDLGNLNFTFFTQQADYDVPRQLAVILAALRKLGIKAEPSGRNDITVAGRKFSGNAFYRSGQRCFHHGTILIRTDLDQLTQYLNVSAEKIRSKGVESVKSRVVNLADLKQGISVGGMRSALISAFGEVYGLIPNRIPATEISGVEIVALDEKFSSWEWIYRRGASFAYECSGRFAWGEFQLQFEVKEGRVVEATVFSDALDTVFIERIPAALQAVVFLPEEMAERIGQIPTADALTRTMLCDIRKLLKSSNF